MIVRRAFHGLPLVRRRHSSSDCPTQVLSRDSGSRLATRPVGIRQFLLPSVTAGRLRCSAHLVCRLGQQLISLGGLLLHDGDLEGGASGRAIGRG